MCCGSRLRHGLTLALALAAMALIGCTNTQAPSPGSGSGAAVSAVAASEQLYQQNCQLCHGKGGSGGGAPALTTSADRPASDLRKMIQDGGKKMPAFGKQLSAEQIDAMVKYIQGFGNA